MKGSLGGYWEVRVALNRAEHSHSGAHQGTVHSSASSRTGAPCTLSHLFILRLKFTFVDTWSFRSLGLHSRQKCICPHYLIPTPKRRLTMAQVGTVREKNLTAGNYCCKHGVERGCFVDQLLYSNFGLFDWDMRRQRMSVEMASVAMVTSVTYLETRGTRHSAVSSITTYLQPRASAEPP